MKTLNLILFFTLLLGCSSVTAQTKKRASTVSTSSKSIKSLSGHQYVDLGLPSGTLWATCNVGADSKLEPGLYFAWGETKMKGKVYYSKIAYKYFDEKVGFTKYAPNQENFSDNKKELDPEDDAAYVNWGECWRMPSFEQIKELANKKYTTWKWVEKNNIYGHYITSKINGAVLFLPATGYYSNGSFGYRHSSGFYWSRDLVSVWWAYGLYFDTTNYGWTDDNVRTEGWCVRPVVSNSGMRKLGKDEVKSSQKANNNTASNSTSETKTKEKTTDYVAPVVEAIDANKVYDTVDEPAKFPGGESAMFNWIKTHQVYPSECKQFGIRGRVRLSCTINQDGSVSNPQSIGSADDRLVKEAVRVVKSMPKWSPAKKSGTAVKSRVEISFTFK